MRAGVRSRNIHANDIDVINPNRGWYKAILCMCAHNLARLRFPSASSLGVVSMYAGGEQESSLTWELQGQPLNDASPPKL